MKNHPHIVIQSKSYESFPANTGRYLAVNSLCQGQTNKRSVALIGDSTIDNSYWVQQGLSYREKTDTVNYQIAYHLESKNYRDQYSIANFAIDGATTRDLASHHNCVRMDKVLPADEDHPFGFSSPLNCVAMHKPDTVVLSVGGNDYREALQSPHNGLLAQTGFFGFLLRRTPDESKEDIKTLFDDVKHNLVAHYKTILNKLLDDESTKRIIITTQYYPALGTFTPYFIYTGFAHVAHSYGSDDHLGYIKDLMDDLYSEIQQHVVDNNPKNKEIIVTDMASSINPLEDNHIAQIEPNRRGAKIMGRLIAEAISYQFPEDQIDGPKPDTSTEMKLAHMRLSLDGESIESRVIKSRADSIQVRHIKEFIAHSRHSYFTTKLDDTLGERVLKTYYCFAGRRVDPQNVHGYGYGLLDLTLLPVIATHLWQLTLNQEHHIALRIMTGLISAPILLARTILATGLTLACMPFTLISHFISQSFLITDPKASLEVNLKTRDDQATHFNAIHSSDINIQMNLSKDELKQCYVTESGHTILSSDQASYQNMFVSSLDMERDIIVDSNPEKYICPITRRLMFDPVIAPTGVTYERKAIENWIDKYGRDPMARRPMRKNELRPNDVAKQITSRYLEKSNNVSDEVKPIDMGTDELSTCIDTFEERLGLILPTMDRDEDSDEDRDASANLSIKSPVE